MIPRRGKRGCAKGASTVETDACLDEIVAKAAAALERRPVTLALEGAFHGKTTGALRLTHNLAYRGPWSRGGGATFVPAERSRR